MKLQGNRWAIHSICHKSHEPYVLDTFKNHFSVSLVILTLSNYSQAKLQGMPEVLEQAEAVSLVKQDQRLGISCPVRCTCWPLGRAYSALSRGAPFHLVSLSGRSIGGTEHLQEAWFGVIETYLGRCRHQRATTSVVLRDNPSQV